MCPQNSFVVTLEERKPYLHNVLGKISHGHSPPPVIEDGSRNYETIRKTFIFFFSDLDCIGLTN